MHYNKVEDLIYALLIEIGLAINEEGLLYDTDTGIVLNIGGKTIKCSVDPNNPVYNSTYSVVFDPINNFKLMSSIFSYYTEKMEKLHDLYTISFSIDEDKTKRSKKNRIPSNIIARCQNGNNGPLYDVVGGYYFNRCLKFADIIFGIAGYAVDLHNFDEVE